MAIRGKPVVVLTNQTTRLEGSVRGHSQKPVEFYDLVEWLCPAPRYADLFSRYCRNHKWDCHGDESMHGQQSRPLNFGLVRLTALGHDVPWGVKGDNRLKS
jgi:N6-adenosine-specific RNA methylase IME4